jgi:hypothetical protein
MYSVTDIHHRVDELMAEGKRSLLRGWSMQSIMHVIGVEFDDPAKLVAREYIVHTKCGIEDEAKYIDKAIAAARQEAKTNSKQLLLKELTSVKSE